MSPVNSQELPKSLPKQPHVTYENEMGEVSPRYSVRTITETQSDQLSLESGESELENEYFGVSIGRVEEKIQEAVEEMWKGIRVGEERVKAEV